MEEKLGDFRYMIQDSGEVGEAYITFNRAVQSKLPFDPKTYQLFCLAYLTANRDVDGIKAHTRMAKQEGATREEVASAILAGFPFLGSNIYTCYTAAVQTYDEIE